MYSAPAWPERKIALSWSSTLPPAPNQARPLCENDGQPRTRTVTIIASSSPTTAQTSTPSIRSTRWSDHFGPYSGEYSSFNWNRYFFLLNAGTPPALVITSPASGLSRIQSMNLVSAGGLGLPSPGRTMNR